MQRFLLLLLLCSSTINLIAQDKVIIVDFQVVDDDTIFFSRLPEVEILAFKTKNDRNTYFLLKRRVLKVYPYAIEAKIELDKIRSTLDTIPKRRKRKRHTKEVAKLIKEEYTDRLRSLSMNEGKILVKLIYRETNITPYEILKSYRGGFNAFFWQTMARFWKNNLKTEYDPENIREDMFIEHILIQAKLEGVLD